MIHVFGPAKSFAEASLASEGGYPADARATNPSAVLSIPKRDFTELLRSRPELALRMLGSMSQHLRVIVGLLDDLALKDTETRVANWLLKRCPRPLRDSPAVIESTAPSGSSPRSSARPAKPFTHAREVPRPEATAGGWAQDHSAAAQLDRLLRNISAACDAPKRA